MWGGVLGCSRCCSIQVSGFLNHAAGTAPSRPTTWCCCRVLLTLNVRVHSRASVCLSPSLFCLSALLRRREDTEAKYYADGEDAYEMRKYFTQAAAAKSKRRRGSKSGADKQRRSSSAADATNSSSSSATAAAVEKVPQPAAAAAGSS